MVPEGEIDGRRMAMSSTPGGPTRHGNMSAFGALLRHWRTVRRLSQFALAEDARTSTRHLSFLETGRSLPSRDMAQRLAESLALAPADANALLLAAGFAPAYAADAAKADDFEALERMLELVLAQHAAVPALVIDAHWNIRIRNAAAGRLFAGFRTGYQLPERTADNVLHILCHPAGLRQFMPDWAGYATPFVNQVRREASLALSETAVTLHDAVQAYPGVAELAGAADDDGRPRAAPPTLHLHRGRQHLSFHTAFTTFSLPFDDMGPSIRMECLYPADGVTATTLGKLAGT